MAPPLFRIRPRRPSDLPALGPLVHAVYAQSGYPVEGPFPNDQQAIDFVSPTNAWQVWVAELVGAEDTGASSAASSATNGGGGSSNSSAGDSTGVDAEASTSASTDSCPASRVVGHVAVTPFMRNAREADWAAAGCTPETAGHLGRLFVGPEAQGKGVGKALVREVMAWAERAGKRLCIYVVTKDVVATGIYERLGWRRIGMQRFNGWDNWMYVWGQGTEDGGRWEGREGGWE